MCTAVLTTFWSGSELDMEMDAPPPKLSVTLFIGICLFGSSMKSPLTNQSSDFRFLGHSTLSFYFLCLFTCRPRYWPYHPFVNRIGHFTPFAFRIVYYSYFRNLAIIPGLVFTDKLPAVLTDNFFEFLQAHYIWIFH